MIRAEVNAGDPLKSILKMWEILQEDLNAVNVS